MAEETSKKIERELKEAAKAEAARYAWNELEETRTDWRLNATIALLIINLILQLLEFLGIVP